MSVFKIKEEYKDIYSYLIETSDSDASKTKYKTLKFQLNNAEGQLKDLPMYYKEAMRSIDIEESDIKELIKEQNPPKEKADRALERVANKREEKKKYFEQREAELKEKISPIKKEIDSMH